jgi:hypothetical protein
MTRNKQWWSRLTSEERSELYWLERAYGGANGGYLPEGYGSCGNCGTPCTGDLCRDCIERKIYLIDKANGNKEREE